MGGRLRGVFALIICAALMTPIAAKAAPDDFAVGDMGDAVLRTQMRLGDLGYTDACVSGIWRKTDAAALAAFERAAAGKTALFSASAPRRVNAVPEESAAVNVQQGELTPWSEVKPQLMAGEGYAVTDCATGIMVRLVYIGGEGFARMLSAKMWDSVTMQGVFRGAPPLAVRPMVIVIGDTPVAASARLEPRQGEEGDPLRAALYFEGSVSGFGGLPDAEHAAAVRIAASGGDAA